MLWSATGLSQIKDANRGQVDATEISRSRTARAKSNILSAGFYYGEITTIEDVNTDPYGTNT